MTTASQAQDPESRLVGSVGRGSELVNSASGAATPFSVLPPSVCLTLQKGSFITAPLPSTSSAPSQCYQVLPQPLHGSSGPPGPPAYYTQLVGPARSPYAPPQLPTLRSTANALRRCVSQVGLLDSDLLDTPVAQKHLSVFDCDSPQAPHAPPLVSACTSGLPDLPKMSPPTLLPIDENAHFANQAANPLANEFATLGPQDIMAVCDSRPSHSQMVAAGGPGAGLLRTTSTSSETTHRVFGQLSPPEALLPVSPPVPQAHGVCMDPAADVAVAAAAAVATAMKAADGCAANPADPSGPAAGLRPTIRQPINSGSHESGDLSLWTDASLPDQKRQRKTQAATGEAALPMSAGVSCKPLPTSSVRERAAQILTILHNEGQPTPERLLRRLLGNTADSSKALRWLVAKGQVTKAGRGGKSDPFAYTLA
ncbi:hypothetical protein WJX72_002300 [[Myrmecia] bisecta]|uniref:HTH three-helical bundle domain-containing protein n=1 Tax=[Myrmecia] bisecta TaxID=41462 RepID=A0AAW1PRE3_9CHLO